MKSLLVLIGLLVSVQACGDDVDPNIKPIVTKPNSPVLRAPFNGLNTGSVHVGSNLSPSFIWEKVENAEFYEIDFTTECERNERDSGVTKCDFVSQMTKTSAETEFELTETLPVSKVPPVGSRYYWRVRACSAVDTCSDWSLIRYLNVGRQTQDINGDGYADLVVGSGSRVGEEKKGANAYVFYGSSAGVSTTADWIFEFEFDSTYSITLPGDINADGFSDLVLSSRRDRDFSSKIILGKEMDLGVSKTSDQLFVNSSAGDFDGDGFVDLLGGDGISSKIFYGTRSANLSEHSSDTFEYEFRDRLLSVELGGSSPTSIGDINGDGYPDIGISYGRSDNPSTHELGVLFGGDKCVPGSGDSDYCDLAEPRGAKLDTTVPFKESFCGTDIDGDGFSDLVVGAPDDITPGDVYIFSGASAFEGQTLIKIPNPKDRDGALFGNSVACGDVNGDGFGDFIIGAPFQLPDFIGATYMFYGSDGAMQTVPDKTLEDPAEEGFGEFGGNVSNVGDLNGDGFDEFGVSEVNWGIETLGLVHILMGDAQMPNSERIEIGSTVENRDSFGSAIGGSTF